MAKQKDLNNAKYDPGCSPEERRAYTLICKEFAGVNTWERLRPGVRQDTWHSMHLDKLGAKKKGQRIDHYVCNGELFDEKRDEQVVSMSVLQGFGSSDHWPILLEFKKNGRNAHDAQRKGSERILNTNTKAKEYTNPRRAPLSCLQICC
jgi:exonuclease III